MAEACQPLIAFDTRPFIPLPQALPFPKGSSYTPQIATDALSNPPVPGIRDLQYRAARQASLNRELPALHIGRFQVGIEEADALPQVCAQAVSGSGRRQQTIRKRICQSPQIVLTIV